MSSTIERWEMNYKLFVNQIDEFNDQAEASNFNIKEIDKIYNIVKEAVKSLQKLLEEGQSKHKALKTRGCCSTSNRTFTLITFGGVISNLSSAVGAIAGIFDENITNKWIGTGFFVVGFLASSGLLIYEKRLRAVKEEVSELEKLQKFHNQLQQVKTFERFLEELKEIKKLEKNFIEIESLGQLDEETLTESSFQNKIDQKEGTGRNLNDRITHCLKEYDNLKPKFRKNEVYGSLISEFINELPPTDPLQIGLEKLEPKTDTVFQKPSVTYLTPTNSGAKKKINWNVEKLSHSESTEQDDLDKLEDMLPGSEENFFKNEQRKNLAVLELSVRERFNLNGAIPYFKTRNGWVIQHNRHPRKICHRKKEPPLTITVQS